MDLVSYTLLLRNIYIRVCFNHCCFIILLLLLQVCGRYKIVNTLKLKNLIPVNCAIVKIIKPYLFYSTLFIQKELSNKRQEDELPFTSEDVCPIGS
jgi:hypothetical protein